MDSKVSRAQPHGFNKVPLVAVLFVFGGFIVINGSLYETGQVSVLDSLNALFLGEPGTDSWMPMRAAHDWLTQRRPGTVYQEVFFNKHIKFQYPLSSLLLFPAFDRLGIRVTDALFNSMSWLAVFVTAGSVAAQTWLMTRRASGITFDTMTAGLLASAAAFMTLTFYPLLKSYMLGQAQTWIDAWFALAVVCWILDRRFLAGLLIGLICAIKPQFLLFLVWASLRRQWTFIAGLSAVVIPATVVSLLLYGLHNNLDYVKVLRFIAQHGESFYPNQSINGLLHRFFDDGGGYLDWHQGVFPPYKPLIYYSSIVSSAVILVLALFWRAKDNSGQLMDFLTAALSFTIASPVAWGHHYGILPPIFVALLLHLSSLPPSSRRSRMLGCFAASFVLAANVFSFTYASPGIGSLPQSYLLFAAIVVLWLLYLSRGRLVSTDVKETSRAAGLPDRQPL